MIHSLAVSGYRSLRDVALTLGPLNVVTGPNGSGKSSLYRSLRLLSDVAQGRAVASLAAEGGLASTLWAGPEKFSRSMRDGTTPVQGTVRSGPVSLKLGFSSDEYGYAIDLGLPVPSRSRFANDPEIKVEAVWTGPALGRANLFAERRGQAVRLRSQDTGLWRESFSALAAHDSMMTHSADATDGLELLMLRERMRAWRFYDDLRTDRGAPSRQPQVGTFTPVLAGDGADLGAAVQTILETGDAGALADTIADAFDGARLSISDQFQVEMRQHGLLRPLAASRAVRRHAPLPAARRRAPVPAPARADDPERTGGKPAPRSLGTSRAAARYSIRTVPARRRIARARVGKGHDGSDRLHAGGAAEGAGRDRGRRNGAAPLGLAVAVMPPLPFRLLSFAMRRANGLRHSWWRLTRAEVDGVHGLALTPAGRIVLVRITYAPGWRVPGGAKGRRETAQAAVLRELREEIGLMG